MKNVITTTMIIVCIFILAAAVLPELVGLVAVILLALLIAWACGIKYTMMRRLKDGTKIRTQYRWFSPVKKGIDK